MWGFKLNIQIQIQICGDLIRYKKLFWVEMKV